MSRRLAVPAALVVVIAAVLLMRQPRPGAAPLPAERRAASRPARAAGPSPEAPAVPERNVFAYADGDGGAKPSPQPAQLGPAPRPRADEGQETMDEDVPEAEPVRLVGLVRRQGRLRAVLSILGEVVILAAGEEAEGYRVLSIDEEAGVSLREPGGSERTLTRREGS